MRAPLIRTISIKLVHIAVGHYNSCMSDHESDPTPDQLRERERTQEQVAREAAADALTEEEARAELRRADKARYLQEKLAEQERADRATPPDAG